MTAKDRHLVSWVCCGGVSRPLTRISAFSVASWVHLEDNTFSVGCHGLLCLCGSRYFMIFTRPRRFMELKGANTCVYGTLSFTSAFYDTAKLQGVMYV